jgi:hypothetical protein
MHLTSSQISKGFASVEILVGPKKPSKIETMFIISEFFSIS